MKARPNVVWRLASLPASSLKSEGRNARSFSEKHALLVASTTGNTVLSSQIELWGASDNNDSALEMQALLVGQCAALREESAELQAQLAPAQQLTASTPASATIYKREPESQLTQAQQYAPTSSRKQISWKGTSLKPSAWRMAPLFAPTRWKCS